MKIITRAILAFVVASLAAACVSGGAQPSQVTVHPPSGTPQPSDGRPESFPVGQPYSNAEFWGGVVPGGDNVEHYDSLAAMTRSADAVVLGTVVGIGQDPTRYQGVDLGGAMFATLRVKVEQVLAGSVSEVAPDEIDVAIFMTDPRQYDRFAARLPDERAILFLRNSLVEAKENNQSPLPGSDHYYRVVSDQGVLRDVAGATRSGMARDPFLMALEATPFSQVVALVSQASR